MNIFPLSIQNITMNQIIQLPNTVVNKNNKHGMFFKIYFLLSIFIMIFSFVYYFNKMSNIDKNESLSKLLIDNYNVSRLYSGSNNTSSIHLSDGTSFSVIGILQIDKINLKYPILSNISEYLLQVAPCKFYGPNLNEIREHMHCFS